MKHNNWAPPKNWTKITTTEMHTGGEPLRIPMVGLPEIKGDTILAKRRFFNENYDNLRTAMMFEPRGHADMYGAFITDPVTEGADFGTFFMHNEGYSTMCGHAIIALTKYVFDTGMITNPTYELLIDAPPGLIRSKAHVQNGIVQKSSFLNVPSFVLLSDQTIYVESIGQVTFDVAYGGAFYAIVEIDEYDISLSESHYTQLIDWGRRIKNVIINNYKIEHPFEADLSFLYGTIFTGRANDSSNHSRNVCVFAEAEVDRSATGSGVSARAALLHHKGELGIGEEITIESILGTTMTVEIKELTIYSDFMAVIPEVTGQAWFCGKNEIWIDPNDPLKQGFIFR